MTRRPALVFGLVLVSACTPGRSARAPGDGHGVDAADGGDGSGSACATSADCAGALVCDRVGGRCTGCRTSGDCEGARRCVEGRCEESATCAGDVQCASEKLVCELGAGRCVACRTAADCATGKACRGGSCVSFAPCASSLECAERRMVCGAAAAPAYPPDAGQGACVECASDADCGAGAACRGGDCHKVCARAGALCGEVEGVACGACAAGSCASSRRACFQYIGLPEGSVQALRVHGDEIFLAYRTTYGDSGGVLRLDKNLRSPVALLQAAFPVDALAVNATHVFFTDTDAGMIKRLRRSGGAPENVAPVKADCWGLAADEQYVYCSRRDYDDPENDGIYRASVAGGPLELLARGEATDDVLVQDGRVWWAEANSQNVRSVLVGGGGLSSHAVDQNHPEFVAVRGDFVYWVVYGQPHQIRRAPIPGGRWTHVRDGEALWSTPMGLVYSRDGELRLMGETAADDGGLLAPADLGDKGLRQVGGDEHSLFGSGEGILMRLDLL